MKTPEKLKLIQKYSGLTQQQLAVKIGVTFAALNRWINEQASPRPGALQKIDELYLEYSGEKVIPENVLQAKKQLLIQKSHGYKDVLRTLLSRPDVRDQFDLSLTYHSNKIEGSTLTENETGAILFQNKAIPNKSLTEHLE
ncbi:MAG: helix-turn-helix transcriptional regulator, partial [Bacteroidota bacterium]